MNSISLVTIFVLICVSTVSASAYSYVKRTDGQSYSYEVGGHSHSPPSHTQHQQIHHQQYQPHQSQRSQYQQQFQQQVLQPQTPNPQQQIQQPTQQTQQVQPSTQQTVTGPIPQHQQPPTQQQQQPQQQNNGPFEVRPFTIQSSNQGPVQTTVNYNQAQSTNNYNQQQTTQTQNQQNSNNFGQNFSGSRGFLNSQTDHKEHFGYPKYKFEYGVKDPRTGDHKSQWEIRDGDVVKGEYTLDEADGTKRIVEYKADSKHGFNAIVKKIGHAHHPEIQVFGHPF